MILNCPKCGKEITGSDIEDKKCYCRSCMEWYKVKDDSVENRPKTDENNKKIRHKFVTIWL
jgi:DNA-directed RNA polymerase subunit M/transcription elongation factor TFIIS